MRAKLFTALSLALPLMLAGCTIRQGSFTVLSTRLVRLSRFDVENAPRTKGVEGRCAEHWALAMFPVHGTATPQEAIDRALEAGDGDLMTDVTLYYRMWAIPYVYMQRGWLVRGDVVQTRKPVSR